MISVCRGGKGVPQDLKNALPYEGEGIQLCLRELFMNGDHRTHLAAAKKRGNLRRKVDLHKKRKVYEQLGSFEERIFFIRPLVKKEGQGCRLRPGT